MATDKILPKHWLVWRLSALGDVVLTSGVLYHLYCTHGWRFTVVTRAAWAVVFAGHPAVDAVLTPDKAIAPVDTAAFALFAGQNGEAKGVQPVQSGADFARRYDGQELPMWEECQDFCTYGNDTNSPLAEKSSSADERSSASGASSALGTSLGEHSPYFFPSAGSLRPVQLFSYCRKLALAFSGCGLLDLHDSLRSRLLGMLWQGRVCRYDKYSWERRAFLFSGRRFYKERLLARTVPQRYARAVEDLVPSAVELVPRVFLAREERQLAKEFISRYLPSTSFTDLSSADVTPPNVLPDTGLGVQSAEKKSPLIALHVYSTHANKAWLDSSWRALACHIVAAGWRCMIIGRGVSPFGEDLSNADGLPAMNDGSDLSDDIYASTNSSAQNMGSTRNLFVDFTNKTSIRETCALLKEADVLVTGDSGPMHLACAVGTPVLALFGPTDRAWGFYPQGKKDTVLEMPLSCRPCSLHGSKPCKIEQRCMRALTVDYVWEELKAKLISYL